MEWDKDHASRLINDAINEVARNSLMGMYQHPAYKAFDRATAVACVQQDIGALEAACRIYRGAPHTTAPEVSLVSDA